MRFLKAGWFIPIVGACVAASIAIVIALLLPQKYVSSATVLFVHEAPEGQPSVEQAQASAFATAQLLEEVIYTSSFREDVLFRDGLGIDMESVPKQSSEQERWWKSAATAQVSGERGALTIEIALEDRVQARSLVYATIESLIESGHRYHGAGRESMRVQLIDGPLTSTRVARPSLGLFAGVGAAAGAIISLLGAALWMRRGGRKSIQGRTSLANVPRQEEVATEKEASSVFATQLHHVEVMPTATSSQYKQSPPTQDQKKDEKKERKQVIPKKNDSIRSSAPSDVAKKNRAPKTGRRSKASSGKKDIKPTNASGSTSEESLAPSFNGSLKELRKQMAQRTTERVQTVSSFKKHPVQQALAGDAVPKPTFASAESASVKTHTESEQKGESKENAKEYSSQDVSSFAEKMQRKLEERAKQRKDTKNKSVPRVDEESVEEWMRSGAFKKTESPEHA